jgi:hypothetical protein
VSAAGDLYAQALAACKLVCSGPDVDLDVQAPIGRWCDVVWFEAENAVTDIG